MRRGGLAQLGERDNGIVEVKGSNPLSSTKLTGAKTLRREGFTEDHRWAFSFVRRHRLTSAARGKIMSTAGCRNGGTGEARWGVRAAAEKLARAEGAER